MKTKNASLPQKQQPLRSNWTCSNISSFCPTAQQPQRYNVLQCFFQNSPAQQKALGANEPFATYVAYAFVTTIFSVCWSLRDGGTTGFVFEPYGASCPVLLPHVPTPSLPRNGFSIPSAGRIFRPFYIPRDGYGRSFAGSPLYRNISRASGHDQGCQELTVDCIMFLWRPIFARHSSSRQATAPGRQWRE